jgi:hypothetical protein
MTRLLLSVGLLGTALIQPVPPGASSQRDEPPAVFTDMPDIIDMSYASPDTWHALPPQFHIHEKPPLPALEPNEVDLPTSRITLAVLN